VLDEGQLPLLVLVHKAHGLVVGGRRDQVVRQGKFAWLQAVVVANFLK